MITAIVILSILVIILGYTTINLMRKNEVAEDIVVNYLQYLDKISRVIEYRLYYIVEKPKIGMKNISAILHQKAK